MNDSGLPDIAASVIDYKARHITTYAVRHNHASECGHECERYLFYQRTAWDKKIPHDTTLEFIFEGGRKIEEMAIAELQEAGYYIVEQQRPFDWKELQLSGRIDCRIRIGDSLVPIEIKGYNHRDYSQLDTIQDFLNSPQPWIRRAPAQLLSYQWMADQHWGGLYLKSKSTFVPKIVWCNIWDHVDYMHAVIDKLERVNIAVQANQEPDRIEYDEKVCLDCAYFHLCTPDVHFSKDAEIDTDPELIEALDRRAQLRDTKKQYEEANRYVKRKVGQRERVVAGQWLITGKWVSGGGDKDGRPAYEYWRTNINRIRKDR